MRSIELIELLDDLVLISVGHRPPIYTVLCILYGRITTAVGCLSDVNSLYGRIAFTTYESCYNKSAKNVPTIAVIPTPTGEFNLMDGFDNSCMQYTAFWEKLHASPEHWFVEGRFPCRSALSLTLKDILVTMDVILEIVPGLLC